MEKSRYPVDEISEKTILGVILLKPKENLSVIKDYIENNKVQAIEFSLRVDEEGYLICDYPDGTEPPDLSINEDGFLVYTY